MVVTPADGSPSCSFSAGSGVPGPARRSSIDAARGIHACQGARHDVRAVFGGTGLRTNRGAGAPSIWPGPVQAKRRRTVENLRRHIARADAAPGTATARSVQAESRQPAAPARQRHSAMEPFLVVPRRTGARAADEARDASGDDGLGFAR